MLGYSDPNQAQDVPDVLSPESVAETVLLGIQKEQFLILPHPQVEGYIQAKAQDPDAWLASMRKLRQRIIQISGSINLEDMHKLI